MKPVPDGDTTPIVAPQPVWVALGICAAGTLVLGLVPGPRAAVRRPPRPHRRLRPVGQRADRCGAHYRRPVIPFERFMADALYGPDGFYTTAGRAGRRGDFLTSPEVGPLFGAVVARFLDAEWARLGSPDPFTVVDAGAGPGTLARSVLAAAPDVPRSDAVRGGRGLGRPTRTASAPVSSRCAELPDGPFDGVIIANELLDNLPFRLAVHDGGWREAYVVDAARRDAGETLSAPFDPLPAVLPERAALGARAPLHDAAAAWVDDARRRLRAGHAASSSTTCRRRPPSSPQRPWREWLRTYRLHERGGHYLVDPGAAGHHHRGGDRPAARARLGPHAGAVAAAARDRRAGRRRQALLGGRTPPCPTWRRSGCASRVGEAEALLDPPGSAAFTVLEYRTGLTCGVDHSGRIQSRDPDGGLDERAARHDRRPDGGESARSRRRTRSRPKRWWSAPILYDEAAAGRRGVLGAPGGRAGRLVAAVAHDPRLAAAVRQVVRRRPAQRVAPTASIATSPPAAATRWPSTGRASRATRARSPTPSCSTRCRSSPTC